MRLKIIILSLPCFINKQKQKNLRKSMPVRIRLTRRGRRHYASYSIVVADSRAPRDGKHIEKLGIYDPNTYPETININVDRAVYWLSVGAQPTDTVRTLLRKSGALYLFHLLRGVKKGALTEEQAYEKFNKWKKEKEEKLRKLKVKVKEQEKKKMSKIIEQEKQIAQKRAEEISKKFAEKAQKEAEKEKREDKE